MSKSTIIFFSFFAIAAFLFSFLPVSGAWEPIVANQDNNVDQNRSIYDTAVNSDDLTILTAAIRQAGLTETLQAGGSYTVLAPNNAAFEVLPQGTLESLLMPENRQQLTGILAYHVVPAEVMSGDISRRIDENGGLYGVRTVIGQDLIFMRNTEGQVTVTDENGNTANVITADVGASNGVVHIIDKVLIPRAQ